MAISMIDNPNELESKIGDLNNLTTSDKSSVVDAINALNSNITTVNSNKASKVSTPYCLHSTSGSITLPSGFLAIILVRCWSTVGAAAAIFSCLAGLECSKIAGGDISVSQNGYTYTFTSPWGNCYLTAINLGSSNPGF